MQPGNRTLPARAISPSSTGLCAFGPWSNAKGASRERFPREQSHRQALVFARVARGLMRRTRQPEPKR